MQVEETSQINSAGSQNNKNIATVCIVKRSSYAYSEGNFYDKKLAFTVFVIPTTDEGKPPEVQWMKSAVRC